MPITKEKVDFVMHQLDALRLTLSDFKRRTKPVGTDITAALKQLEAEINARPTELPCKMMETGNGLAILESGLIHIMRTKAKDKPARLAALRVYLDENRFDPVPQNLWGDATTQKNVSAHSVLAAAIVTGDKVLVNSTKTAFSIAGTGIMAAGRKAVTKGVHPEAVASTLQLSEEDTDKFITSAMRVTAEASNEQAVTLLASLSPSLRLTAIRACLPNAWTAERLKQATESIDAFSGKDRNVMSFLLAARQNDPTAFHSAVASKYVGIVEKSGACHLLFATASGVINGTNQEQFSKRVQALVDLSREAMGFLNETNRPAALKLAKSQLMSMLDIEKDMAGARFKVPLNTACAITKSIPFLHDHLNCIMDEYGAEIVLSEPKATRLMLHFRGIDEIMSPAIAAGKTKIAGKIMDYAIGD